MTYVSGGGQANGYFLGVMSETLKASRTAVLVCQGRAVAHGRIAVGRFADPTAMPLLRPEEREPVQRVRDGAVPGPWPQRLDYETVKASAELMAPRTVAIDDAVRAHLAAKRPGFSAPSGGPDAGSSTAPGFSAPSVGPGAGSQHSFSAPSAGPGAGSGTAPQVVILGAGLDGRAWRMPELAGRAVFEVDQPASQQDKRDRATALPGTPPVFVPVDFGRDRLGAALADAGHRAGEATVWIWEGVVPYLTAAEVAATTGEIAACSAPGSRLIVNYQAPSVRATVGRRVLGPLMSVAGRRNPWAAEPWRSVWTAASMAAVLGRHGFTVREDHDLLTSATALGLAERRPTSRRNGRVAVADR
jgi:methyltransferase (TIGR00027 family)